MPETPNRSRDFLPDAAPHAEAASPLPEGWWVPFALLAAAAAVVGVVLMVAR